MDFNEDFLNLQRALNSARNLYGSLCEASISGDSKRAEEITNKLTAVIQKKYKEFLNVEPENLHDGLRKIVFLLMLNSDLYGKDFEDLLLSDDSCGHLIGSIPTISKGLIVSLLWGMGMQEYVYEFVAHGPPVLIIGLIDALIEKQKSLELIDVVQLNSKLFVAVFTQLLKLSVAETGSENVRNMWCKLRECLKTLMMMFLQPKGNIFEGKSTDDLHYFAGCAMKNLLWICENCLKCLKIPKEEILEHPIYRISVSNDYCIEECSHEEAHEVGSFTEIINEMFAACLFNLRGITVDLWLFWVECDETDERNLQLNIAEACYRLSEAIKGTHHLEKMFSDMEELQFGLQRFAIKPRSEDDVIMSADVGTAVHNIANGDKNLKKWWKAFLAFDCLCDTENTLECLERNLSLVDKTDVCRILDIVAHKLTSETLDANLCERLKLLAIKAVMTIELPLQLEALYYFFQNHGVTSLLETREFAKDCTEFFNKTVEFCKEGQQEEFAKQSVALCLQSVEKLLVKALSEVLGNRKQLAVVVNALKGLKVPLSTLTVQGHDLLLHSINNIIGNGFSEDNEVNNFICMVVALVNERLVSGKLYLELFVLPQIHETASRKDWPHLIIRLQMLLVFVDGTVNEGKSFNVPAVLIMLAQLMEAVRWNIFTFTTQAASVRKELIVLINALLNENTGDLEEESSASWLILKLKSILTPVNIPYFKRLWAEDEFVEYDNDLIFTLVASMHGLVDQTTLAELIRASPKEDIFLLKASILKVLPVFISQEWKLLSNCIENVIIALKPESNAAIELFHIFADVILTITIIVNRKNGMEHSGSYLDFCLKNIGVLVMEKVCPAITSESTEPNVTVFQKVLYLFEILPQPVKQLSCPVWVNVCATLVANIIDSQQTAEKPLVARHLAVSLSTVSALDLRQPLAKKLWDVLYDDD